MDPKVASFDPGARGRPPLQTKSVELPESGLTLEFTWRRNDLLAASAAAQDAEQLIQAHVTGDEVSEPEILVVAGEPVEDLPEKLVQDICLLRRMQKKGERCSFLWWLSLALCVPEDYSAAYAAALELMGETSLKNSPTPETPISTG